MSHTLTRKFLAYLDRKKTNAGWSQIEIDELGIKLRSQAGQNFTIPWPRIKRILAFKRDLFSRDMICLLIEQENKLVYEVNESTPGWAELVNQIPVRLPSAKSHAEWFLGVAFPAFDVSATAVFLRCPTIHPVIPAR